MVDTIAFSHHGRILSFVSHDHRSCKPLVLETALRQWPIDFNTAHILVMSFKISSGGQIVINRG